MLDTIFESNFVGGYKITVDSVFSMKSCFILFFRIKFFDGLFREATPATPPTTGPKKLSRSKVCFKQLWANQWFRAKKSVSNRVYWVYRVYWHLLRSIDRKPTAEAVPGDSALSCRVYRMTLAWHWAKFAKTNHTVCNVTDDTIPQLWKVDRENCSWFHHSYFCSIWTRAV